ncbi:hypothetical protein Dimus_009015 [Dionaea muscipula]
MKNPVRGRGYGCRCLIVIVIVILVLAIYLSPLRFSCLINCTSEANPRTNYCSAPGSCTIKCWLTTCNNRANLHSEQEEIFLGKSSQDRKDAYSNCSCDSSTSEDVALMSARRNLLMGRLGSRPPSCSTKCGKCKPCKPVHVTVPPGNPVTAEYYPEAWRCKCGNRLFLP